MGQEATASLWSLPMTQQRVSSIYRDQILRNVNKQLLT